MSALPAKLTVTSKGQVTLRKDVLAHLGLATGGKLLVDKLPDGRIQLKAERPTGEISDLFGIFEGPEGHPFTMDEINEAIRKGWAGER